MENGRCRECEHEHLVNDRDGRLCTVLYSHIFCVECTIFSSRHLMISSIVTPSPHRLVASSTRSIDAAHHSSRPSAFDSRCQHLRFDRYHGLDGARGAAGAACLSARHAHTALWACVNVSIPPISLIPRCWATHKLDGP